MNVINKKIEKITLAVYLMLILSPKLHARRIGGGFRPDSDSCLTQFDRLLYGGFVLCYLYFFREDAIMFIKKIIAKFKRNKIDKSKDLSFNFVDYFILVLIFLLCFFLFYQNDTSCKFH